MSVRFLVSHRTEPFLKRLPCPCGRRATHLDRVAKLSAMDLHNHAKVDRRRVEDPSYIPPPNEANVGVWLINPLKGSMASSSTTHRTKQARRKNKRFHTPRWYKARLSLKHDDSYGYLSVALQSFTGDDV